jgi:hypothetical protein
MSNLSNIQFNNLEEFNGELSNHENMISDDFLMISEQTSQNIFTSKKVNISSLFDDINDYYTNVNNITFNLDFEFLEDSSISVTTNIINHAIENNNNKTTGCKQLINLEYAYEKFNTPLVELSSTLYEDNIIIPSYVGEIIYTTTLRSERHVQKYYGINTSWKPICARFILGVSNEKTSDLNTVNVYGGEVTHTLDISEIPPHIHKFKPSTEVKELKSKTSLTSDENANVGVISDKLCNPEDDDYNYNCLMFGCKSQENKADGVPYAEWVSIFGENGPDCKIEENKSLKKNHNNIPPFRSLYIWERIS